MQGLQTGPIQTQNLREIEMKYSQQEKMIRDQYAQKAHEMKAQGRAALDRYMQARSECAAGNDSSCQMIAGLKAAMDQLDTNRERLAQEEQQMISELDRQKQSEMDANQPQVFYDMGSVRTSTPGMLPGQP